MNQIEEMKTFVRVIESGSITHAAEQMGVAKSAVSKRLSDLETRLGVILLNRTTRKQALTDLGESYYQKCLQILADIDELEASVQNTQCALRGKIRLAAPLSFGLMHLVPALNTFNEIHPDIHFEIDFNDRKVDIVEEGYDMAFRIAELQDSRLIAQKITSIRIYLLASPDYLKSHTPLVHPHDLLQGHVKLHYTSSADQWEFRDGGKSIKIKIPNVLASNNGNHLLDEAVKGKGIVSSPDFLCYKHVKSEQLVPLLSDFSPSMEIGAYAIYPQTRSLSRRVRSLIDYLKSYYGSQPYWSLIQ